MNTETNSDRFEIDHLTVSAIADLSCGQTGLGWTTAGYYAVTRNEDGLAVITLEWSGGFSDVPAKFVVLPQEVEAKADLPINVLVGQRVSDWMRRNL